MALSLCGCGPAAPAVAKQPTATPAQTTGPTAAPTPAPDVSGETAAPAIEITLAPTAEPTAAPTPEPTPVPTDTPVPTPRSERTVAGIVEEMAVCFAQYGEEASARVGALLEEMATVDPDAARRWTAIMDRWRTLESRVEVNIGVLPDGLPDTGELCIVALGYSLNANGTMKQQLKDRLQVVKESARKYPNALVLCTGGGTASKKKNYTEAGQMRAWLRKNGVDKDRILRERASLTTAQNARFSLELLGKEHPEVRYLAIVSGDYHLKVGVLLFEAEAILRAPAGAEPAYEVVAVAGCKTANRDLSPLFQAGGLVELAGDAKTASRLYHDRYDLKQWPPL